jgi:hypothetical protein
MKRAQVEVLNWLLYKISHFSASFSSTGILRVYRNQKHTAANIKEIIKSPRMQSRWSLNIDKQTHYAQKKCNRKYLTPSSYLIWFTL